MCISASNPGETETVQLHNFVDNCLYSWILGSSFLVSTLIVDCS
jgi:hypothetical protein